MTVCKLGIVERNDLLFVFVFIYVYIYIYDYLGFSNYVC